MELEIITKENLLRKYNEELFANEIAAISLCRAKWTPFILNRGASNETRLNGPLRLLPSYFLVSLKRPIMPILLPYLSHLLFIAIPATPPAYEYPALELVEPAPDSKLKTSEKSTGVDA